MSDDDPIPPTLADISSYGVDVFCWCNRCHHHAVTPIAVLIAHCGPRLPFPEVHGRLRCQACGSRDIHARPNWRGLGVVAKHEKVQIRQFVAMPLGDGYSVEEQVTGDAEHGGVQIIVYPMKAERYEALQRKHEVRLFHLEEPQPCMSEPAPDMGLAPGGRMTQEIYEDSYGLDAWDQRHSSRCFITIANSVLWSAVTGETPPTKAPMADQYTKAGLPWFDYYDESQTALGGADTLSAVLSVSDMGKKKGKAPLPENNSVDVDTIIKLRDRRSNQVREYDHIQM